ncbi:MAG TPA: sulfatase [Puia sp.]|nr:sulfatase [Puia sp.]
MSKTGKLRALAVLAVSLLSLFFLVPVLSSFSSGSSPKKQQQPTTETKEPAWQASKRPNILLIVSEDHGPDLGCYGSADVKTPTLDDLAARGIRFDRAFVTYPVCSPSRGSIFTGLYPHQNGQIGLATHKYRMYPGTKTLPAYLNEAGYRTGCIGKIHVNPESDIPFGFRPPKKSPLLVGNFARKNLPEYTHLADSFFRQSNDPFFLMVNYPDAHFPWKHQVNGMPAHPMSGEDLKSSLPFIGANSARLRSFIADYYNSIERLDDMVRMLLDKLKASGKDSNTLIIFLADHGAEFSRGKFSNYESGLHVPMIIYWPGKTEHGGVRKELVSSIDLLPTILEAAKAKIPETLPGKPLQPLFEHTARRTWRKYIFAESEGSFPHAYYPRSSIRDERYKLIHNLLYQRENPEFNLFARHLIEGFDGGTETEEIAASGKIVQQAYATWRNPPEFELYDLEKDPYEFNNLSADKKYKAILDRLKNKLADWQKETKDPLSDETLLKKFTAEVDAVTDSHPKMDDAKDTSFSWNYPEYFLQYIHEHSK